MVSLSQTKHIIHSLHKRDRTEITPKNYFKRCAAHTMLQFAIGVALGISLLMWAGISIFMVSAAISLALIPLALCMLFRRKTRSIVIKGDTLILKNYRKSSLVTSLRSIHKVRTYKLPGVYITRLTYNLDGKDRKTLVINRSWAVVSTPEKLIRKAMELSRKERKKKANL